MLVLAKFFPLGSDPGQRKCKILHLLSKTVDMEGTKENALNKDAHDGGGSVHVSLVFVFCVGSAGHFLHPFCQEMMLLLCGSWQDMCAAAPSTSRVGGTSPR